MLLTGIGVLVVLLIGVLLPSRPDNLAIGVSPVGELLRLRLLCSSSAVCPICRKVIYKEKKDESFIRLFFLYI